MTEREIFTAALARENQNHAASVARRVSEGTPLARIACRIAMAGRPGMSLADASGFHLRCATSAHSPLDHRLTRLVPRLCPGTQCRHAPPAVSDFIDEFSKNRGRASTAARSRAEPVNETISAPLNVQHRTSNEDCLRKRRVRHLDHFDVGRSTFDVQRSLSNRFNPTVQCPGRSKRAGARAVGP